MVRALAGMPCRVVRPEHSAAVGEAEQCWHDAFRPGAGRPAACGLRLAGCLRSRLFDVLSPRAGAYAVIGAGTGAVLTPGWQLEAGRAVAAYPVVTSMRSRLQPTKACEVAQGVIGRRHPAGAQGRILLASGPATVAGKFCSWTGCPADRPAGPRAATHREGLVRVLLP